MPPAATRGLSAQLLAARRLRAVDLTVQRLGREAWRATVRAEAHARPGSAPPSSSPRPSLAQDTQAWRERARQLRAEAPPCQADLPAARRAPSLAERLQRAGVPPAYRVCTLGSFAARTAGDPAKVTALEAARAWDGRQSLVLAGAACGSGKTGLGSALVRECLERGVAARWLRVSDLLAELRSRQRPGSRAHAEDLMAELRAIPVLMLDDLGAERATEFAIEHLRDLLDHRLAWSRPTLITTNLTTPGAIAERYGAPIASRLRDRDRCRWVRLEGADLRDAGTVSVAALATREIDR